MFVDTAVLLEIVRDRLQISLQILGEFKGNRIISSNSLNIRSKTWRRSLNKIEDKVKIFRAVET